MRSLPWEQEEKLQIEDLEISFVTKKLMEERVPNAFGALEVARNGSIKKTIGNSKEEAWRVKRIASADSKEYLVHIKKIAFGMEHLNETRLRDVARCTCAGYLSAAGRTGKSDRVCLHVGAVLLSLRSSYAENIFGKDKAQKQICDRSATQHSSLASVPGNVALQDTAAGIESGNWRERSIAEIAETDLSDDARAALATVY